jgi:hypothetical protein
MKQSYIYETLNDAKSMTISKENGLMTLSGTFGVCGVRNNNSRVYETSNYKKMVEEMQGRIRQDGGIPGELEHPQYMNITLENISHKITDINIDENGVVSGTITLLNTPKGKIAQSIVEGGLPLFISSRAMGNVDPKTGAVTLERISTYDLVGTPGFSQARLHLNESQMVDFENKMSAEGRAEVGDDVYTQIPESNIFYVTEKEQETNIENKPEENNMEMNEILEKLEKLEKLEERVQTLEDENKKLNEALEKAPKFDLEQLCEGIQNWCVNEFAPKIAGWVTEEFAPEYKGEMVDEAMDAFKDYLLNEAAPKIQTWVVEEFGGEVERWATTEFAQGIQSWIVEEYAPASQAWLNEHYAPKVEEQIANAVTESKKNSLSSIEDTLKLLEGIEVSKPIFKSAKSVNEDAPKFIQEMPEAVRPLYESASDEMKESINRRAKLYNFNNEGAIQRFWESIDFNVVPQVKNIYEGLEQIADERERAIRAQFRAWRSIK